MSDRLSQLLKLHETDPDDPFLTYGVAMEHVGAERFDDALAWLDKTLALDTGYCYAYFQKAKALSQLGRDDDAVAAVEAGLEVARRVGDEKALGELGELREMLVM